jgi:malate permease and related proteins
MGAAIYSTQRCFMDKVFLITGIFTIALLLRRFGAVRETHSAILVRYVMTVSLPCLTLMTIGTLDLRQAHFDIAVIAWLVMSVGAIIAYFTGKAVGLKENSLRSFMLASTFPNTAFLGYPFSYSLFGSAGLSYAIIYDQMGMFPFFFTLGFFIAGGKESLLHMLRFPPLIALVAAFLLNLAGLPPSGQVAKILGAVGWTTLPLTIFLIGLKVRFTPRPAMKGVFACLTLRMLIMPALLFIMFYLTGKDGVPYRVALLESAMPPALTTGILAIRYRLDEDLAVSCISLGTVISLFMFSMAMWFM